MASTTVQRSEPCGISVLVSGAGVGGLMTAMECWRKGCDVRIFERTKSNITTGDSFTIGPTAIHSFHNWPGMLKENEEIAYDPMVAYHKHTGERISGPLHFIEEMFSTNIKTEMMPKRVYRHSRPKFHAMLLGQLQRIGIEVEYGNEVVDHFENGDDGKAGVVLKDGFRHEADLVVAADGVRGNSWPLVAGHAVPARSSGHAIFRVAYPVENVLADPMIAERFPLSEDGRSVFEMWVGPDMHATFWRNQDQMSYTITHDDHGTAEESWGHRVDPKEVLKFTATVPGWPEVADRVIKATPPDQLVDWKLMWRNPQPNWRSPVGRVIQLGDAAHTFLPTSGNGGTQAIEDAVSLAACLDIAGKDNIPSAVRVHNLLRFERVSCLQAFGVVRKQKVNTQFDDKSGDDKQMRAHLGRWIIEHDPEQYAYKNYDQALKHLVDGAPFQNTNTPPGHVYRPWTIDGLLEAQKRGELTVLDGDWN